MYKCYLAFANTGKKKKKKTRKKTIQIKSNQMVYSTIIRVLVTTSS